LPSGQVDKREKEEEEHLLKGEVGANAGAAAAREGELLLPKAVEDSPRSSSTMVDNCVVGSKAVASAPVIIRD
jgi:hypothetical protein